MNPGPVPFQRLTPREGSSALNQLWALGLCGEGGAAFRAPRVSCRTQGFVYAWLGPSFSSAREGRHLGGDSQGNASLLPTVTEMDRVSATRLVCVTRGLTLPCLLHGVRSRDSPGSTSATLLLLLQS